MALAGDPEVLVAIELSEERVPAPDALIATRGLGERVHVHNGVDQADARQLGRLVDDHLAGRHSTWSWMTHRTSWAQPGHRSTPCSRVFDREASTSSRTGPGRTSATAFTGLEKPP